MQARTAAAWSERFTSVLLPSDFKANCNYLSDSANQEDRESLVLALLSTQAR